MGQPNKHRMLEFKPYKLKFKSVVSVLVVVQQSKRSDKNSMFSVCIFVFESVKIEEFIVETMNHTATETSPF